MEKMIMFTICGIVVASSGCVHSVNRIWSTGARLSPDGVKTAILSVVDAKTPVSSVTRGNRFTGHVVDRQNRPLRKCGIYLVFPDEELRRISETRQDGLDPGAFDLEIDSTDVQRDDPTPTSPPHAGQDSKGRRKSKSPQSSPFRLHFWMDNFKGTGRPQDWSEWFQLGDRTEPLGRIALDKWNPSPSLAYPLVGTRPLVVRSRPALEIDDVIVLIGIASTSDPRTALAAVYQLILAAKDDRISAQGRSRLAEFIPRLGGLTGK